jgi:hypothetical protein
MADGEVCGRGISRGVWRVRRLSRERGSGSTIVICDGPVQFVARGPKTQMLCRGMSNPMGHGNGECQTYDGAVWAIRVAALLREPRRLLTRSGRCLGNRDEAHGARGNTL